MRLRDILRQIPAVSWPRPARKTMEDLRRSTIKAEAAAERMRRQRDNTDRENNQLIEQLARMSAEKQFQDDHIRKLEASLSDAREQLRQAQREIARVGQEAAEMALTADGLGLAMAELERAAQRRVILPGQRADLDDLGEEKRHFDGQGDQ